ncbi:ankyrin repeat and SOCS box protein 7-like [Anneissia japonica]|uniref:ankyrin repeat and SOCS box protein 7-like n=1 Tax=Anneissia japonica TaxID=1529436 RepID=UPI0014255818|nr:ankyrin repeat and SOCS box protein 7-like [Anneissia japonica]XP_033110731.1 ankyrin repeat and SOCS box protein 7-like [Anneissia japonica]XP_033110732.1 ankyrin repeat and SOCS box protein 7-like [Anneissia japonica]XP_033110733.1 ankyrin repeat and SOCS box protein 7-like [Anneissia japonica]XP_033110734.1 ankyrin repeat and SOCS box protein 7-like [Anneissia japonica]XP_033110735.1 ankyrin repeat and SOCS box protein 7-like [Anneissia japonica]XP_033110736.1 ankyrin repeat and SOCS bo
MERMCTRSHAIQRAILSSVDREIRKAVATGNIHKVQMLLLEGSSPNTVDSNGWTLLHLAASRGTDRVLRILLQYGGNPEIKDRIGGFTCLHYAAMHGRTRLARMLLEVTRDKFHFIDTPSNDGWTSLHVAAHYGRDSFVKTLLHFRASVDPLSTKSTTPLQLAVIKQKLNCVRILIGAKACINVQCGFPLRYAIIKGYHKTVELLLNEGADPTIGREEDNQTPLHLAVMRDEVDLCQILYRFGAVCYVQNDLGQTPLTIAKTKICVNGQLIPRSCQPVIEEFAGNPRSLQDLCRFVIRANVFRLSELYQLPLSTCMINYLKYKFDW